jgi:alkyl hydroperoxide reductase subunit AhpC
MVGELAAVGKRAPDFDMPCTAPPGESRQRISLDDYRDRWLVLVFYPRDFSLVCPTELTALSNRIEDFRRRSCDILGVSTDSIESHQRWIETPRSQGGLANLEFPLASDEDGTVARAYGVFLEQQHIALRGLFIVDPNGVLQYQTVHNLSVGRRSEDVLRVLAALETGGMCPEGWREDSPVWDPTSVVGAGRMISHYRIEAEVGQGSYASVYRAHDTRLDRTVALKLFRPGGLPTPADILAEARSAAALNHPNVCTVFAVDDSQGVPMIAMEYVDGRPLSSVVDGSPLSLEEVCRIGRQIAQGIGAAHRMGIVHGDLKPANIMVTRDGVAKITDFGLSRRAGQPVDSQETQPWQIVDNGTIAGTPSYMAPEQTRGERAVPASDVFALGAVLYEMLTGRVAFTGDNVLQVLAQIRSVDPARYAAEVPSPFDRVLRDALVPDPRQRRVTMDQVAHLLG